MKYDVLKESSWKEWSAKAGDTLDDTDLPADVVKALASMKAIGAKADAADKPAKIEAVPAAVIKS